MPQKLTLDAVEAAARKEGEVLHIKLDKRKAHAVWIEFKDKLSARRVARKGLHVDDVRCRAVRVRPITARPEDAHRAAVDAAGRPGLPSRTLMVKGLPVAGGARGLEDRLRQIFAACGNVTGVRVSPAREMASTVLSPV